MTDPQQYSVYLAKRSWLGAVYRNQVLYPRLCKHLKGRVLDIGCGIGDMLKFRPDTVGVDVNPFNVDICLSRRMSAQTMEIDVLPFVDESFDCALLDNVLEHVPAPEKLLSEIRRILRPGGCLVAGVPGVKGQQSDPDHKVFYDEAALASLATRNGFILNKLFHMPFFKSEWLSKHLRQYCIYSVWVKN